MCSTAMQPAFTAFLMNCTMAALLMGYSQRPVCAAKAEMEAKLTTAPPPRFCMWGAQACSIMAAPTTLTFQLWFHSARVEATPLST
jgi:hypothetical protein